MPQRRTPATAGDGAGAGDRQAASDDGQHSPSGGEIPDPGARWSIHRLDTFEARIMAAAECPWFVEWFRGMATGQVACIHCGGDGRDTGLIGATQIDDDQLITITACRECCSRSANFEAAARAAVDAAEVGVLTRGRSFTHSVVAPESVQ